MSGRLCSAARSVFFIAQAKVLESVPEGGDAQAHFESAGNARLEFGQGQIGLLGDPAAQSLVMLFQAGTTVAAPLLRLDAARGRVKFAVTLHTALGEFEELGERGRAVSAFSGRDDAFAQIGAVGSHSPIVPQKRDRLNRKCSNTNESSLNPNASSLNPNESSLNTKTSFVRHNGPLSTRLRRP